MENKNLIPEVISEPADVMPGKPETSGVSAGSAGAASVAAGDTKATIGADNSKSIQAGDNVTIDASTTTNTVKNIGKASRFDRALSESTPAASAPEASMSMGE